MTRTKAEKAAKKDNAASLMPASSSSSPSSSFEVYVKKDSFKFHAAHFVAFEGFRERLHGHNYKMAVRVLGSSQIRKDGYVVDFGDIKAVVKDICKELNEHFLCPMRSDVLDVHVGENEVDLECHVDGAKFTFPRSDCSLLPIAHATTEELAVYLWSRLLKSLDASFLSERGVHAMAVTVEEADGQEATFSRTVPKQNNDDAELDVLSFIAEGDIRPRPCASAKTGDKNSRRSGGVGCRDCISDLSKKLSVLAAAINRNEFSGEVTVADLKRVLGGENGNKSIATSVAEAAAAVEAATTGSKKKRPAASSTASASSSPQKSKSKVSVSSPKSNKKAKTATPSTPMGRTNDIWIFLESQGWTSETRNHQKYFFPPGVTRENGKNRKDYFDSIPLSFNHVANDTSLSSSKELSDLMKKYPELLKGRSDSSKSPSKESGK